ncbi:segregation and condensation protein A [Syntrophotalea acetylenica]|jgi:segregation and condensation protein A|uniref:Segregation and condensation protein A n=1 Tax=Syntrophotalea acetylenica TaxID=29542 RepID=A0A1L3GI22_SYNAC|nr:segregation/condensation protein A [Syntrophotalea acetylenica]APG25525.1 chromosome segregation protein ScpA [Syntrophotalea acetylenica]APG43589.1 chromosome segregation protein ScpA [Syntrophotalea acetylenica]MDY0262101.1 segregation/condensation protein A [Syntrophotalea acetylenica]
MPYEIELEMFKGPLDLLLHLIKKHEMDIYDIPIAEITSQYLQALDAMRALNLDVAGEFLVMASTLVHIKSRMLLPLAPDPEPDEEDIDPRAELVSRLLEYQRYKDAAAVLDASPMLGRDVFGRACVVPSELQAGDAELQPVGVFELAEALQRLLQDVSPEPVHQVVRERLSVAERVAMVLEALKDCQSLAFETLLPGPLTREELVVTFLAVLELVKLRLVRIMQNCRCGAIWLFPGVVDGQRELPLQDESFGYC